MNLFEWKKSNTETLRDELKDLMREGADVESHYLFTEQDLSEMQEEVRIEEWYEIVEFDEEIELDAETITEDVDCLVEYFDFVPSIHEDKMDIEIEIDLDEMDPSMELIRALKETFLAEDFDVDVSENKAKVVFNRSSGKIVKRKKCGPGMRLKGNRCMPQTGTQKAGERRKGIKLKRAKRAMGAGKKKRAAIKARITKKRVAGRSRSISNTVN